MQGINDIVKEYAEAKKAFDAAEDKLRNHFNQIVLPMIEKASTPAHIQAIKEFLRVMPESASKVLLFRSILIKEETYKILS
jgi:predicted protein tyrosine phosphatase